MATSEHSLDWAEHAPGIWQRDIDEVELFWATAARVFDTGRRRRFMVTGHLSITASSSPDQDINDALRKAWCHVRFAHPSIASQVYYDPKTERFTRHYKEIRSPSDLDSWMQSTFVEVSANTSGADFANSDPPAPEIATMFILTPKTSDNSSIRRDIILRAPHDTIDGVGMLTLLGNLLRYASSSISTTDNCDVRKFDGSEVRNLSPHYRAAAKVPPKITFHQRARVKKLFSEHVFFSQQEPAKEYISIPFRTGAQIPGRHQRTDITLTKTETLRVLARCKDLGVSITHAINAAIPLALRNLTPEANEKSLIYRCDMLRNLRPFCADSYATSQHPVTAYHAGSSFGLEVEVPRRGQGNTLEQDFEFLLQRVHRFYQRVANDSEHWYLVPHIWNGWLKTLPALTDTPKPGPPPSPHPGVTLSSLGRLDELIPPELSGLTISRPWITGEEMGNGLGLFLSSHQGELTLVAAFNEAWQTEHDAQAFLKACLRIACEGVGVSSDLNSLQ